MADTQALRVALKRKIDEIGELEKTLDRDKCIIFYASTARLIEDIEGSESHELADFRPLDGYSSVHSGNELLQEEWDTETYYDHLKKARSILIAVDESLEWRMPTSASGGNNNGRGITVNGDAVKQAVLDHLYEKQQQQPHRLRGWSSIEIMHHLPEFEPSDVRFAVDFLDGEGWLKHTTDRGTRFYRLSSKALDRYQPSEFRNKPFSAIQIHNMNGVMVMGDNLGTINQDYTEGIQDIDKLIDFLMNAGIPQDAKRDIVSDLETIKTQLLKKQPNAGIIKSAWSTVTTAVAVIGTLTSATGIIENVGHHLAQFIK